MIFHVILPITASAKQYENLLDNEYNPNEESDEKNNVDSESTVSTEDEELEEGTTTEDCIYEGQENEQPQNGDQEADESTTNTEDEQIDESQIDLPDDCKSSNEEDDESNDLENDSDEEHLNEIESEENDKETHEENLDSDNPQEEEEEPIMDEESEKDSIKEEKIESKIESRRNSSMSSLSIKESTTSKLGHIRNSNVEIYTDQQLKDSFKAGDEYTNKVYYIKKQANVDGQIYYLISNSPSSVNGTVGWVSEKHLSTHDHNPHDKKQKTFYFNGNGKTYSKAWGGSKDIIYNDLSKYTGVIFQAHLTERVGNNTWYRGKVDGQTMWIHSSYVTEIDSSIVSKTSRLGHIKRGDVKIYSDLSITTYTTAGSEFTNAVYYIKSQAKINNQLYYLISTSPSSTQNTVGWVKSNDLSTHTHNGTDKTPKKFYFNGNGKAYSKAWGGSKDLVEGNLGKLKGQVFEVNFTERVGSNVWHRGTINGQTAWIHSSYLVTGDESKTSRLGHLRSNAKTIYKEIGKESTSMSAEEYKNAVYYIKLQTKINGELFYLLSASPSSTEGIIGWINSKEVSSWIVNTKLDENYKVCCLN